MNANKDFVFKYMEALNFRKGKGTYRDYERMKKCFQNHTNYPDICIWITDYLGL